jgi:hypothetical protein
MSCKDIEGKGNKMFLFFLCAVIFSTTDVFLGLVGAVTWEGTESCYVLDGRIDPCIGKKTLR